jgi:hypothetical protein
MNAYDATVLSYKRKFKYGKELSSRGLECE